MGRILFTISIRRVAGTRDPLPFKIERDLTGTMFVAGLSFCSYDDEPNKKKGRKISLGRIDSYLKRTEAKESDRFVVTFKDERAVVAWLEELRSKEENVANLLKTLQGYFRFTPFSWVPA